MMSKEQTMTEPREYTIEEVRDMFLDEIAGIAARLIRDDNEGKAVAVSKAVFGVLSTLEGSGYLPFFDVIPSPSAEDREYHRAEGDNWFPNDGRLLTGEDHHDFSARLVKLLGASDLG